LKVDRRTRSLEARRQEGRRRESEVSGYPPQREATNCPENPRACVEPHSSLPSACPSSSFSSALLTRDLHAPHTTRRQRVHDPFLRPRSALSLRFLSLFSPPVPSAPHLACPSAQDASPPCSGNAHDGGGSGAQHDEPAALRAAARRESHHRPQTTNVHEPIARGPMAQSGSRIAPRPAASRAPATHTKVGTMT
jgi:hypothetical protein